MRSGQTRGVVMTESEATRRVVEPVLRAAGYRIEHAQGSLDTLRRLSAT